MSRAKLVTKCVIHELCMLTEAGQFSFDKLCFLLACVMIRCSCSQDVVEVPSHLWEHFATDARSLSLLARHADSRQPMPQAMARQLARLSTVTPALELQQQVTSDTCSRSSILGLPAASTPVQICDYVSLQGESRHLFRGLHACSQL